MKQCFQGLVGVFFIWGLISCEPKTGTPEGASEYVGETVRLDWEEDQVVPKSVILSTRALRERLLADPHRPGYHFCVPEDRGVPGDPNGAFFANGRYHLMYLYNRQGSGFAYGHISSKDLLHWRHHPDALLPGGNDDGLFSGGGYVDENGKATLTYWEYTKNQKDENVFKQRKFGIGIAHSTDKHYDTWTKSASNPVIRSTAWGITETTDKDGNKLIYGSADPSQIWKKDGKYYMLTGNLLVLRKFGSRGKGLPADQDEPELSEDSLKYQGDWLDLFVSDDMNEWEYLHKFYERNPEWTEKTEDNMCPSFLPLPSSPDGGPPSDKHLLLFISHNMGCQYYVGSYRNDRFYPDNHGRMSWQDNEYFAPEALMDNQGRQIMWAWIMDALPDHLKDVPDRGRLAWEQNYYGWTGVYGLPRSLWLGEDGTLRMRPVKELANLRQNERVQTDLVVKAGEELTLEGFGDKYLELEIVIQPGSATQCGVKVACSEDGREETALYYDATNKTLSCDATISSLVMGRRNVENGPFELKAEETLTLRVFVDGSIVEIFANDRQALGRRIYPSLGGTGVKLFAEGGDMQVKSVKAWEMMPTNPY